MNDKASTQISAGSDKAGPHPGHFAPPAAESTRTHSVFVGCYLGRLRQNSGQEASLAQTLLGVIIRTESCDSVVSS